MKLVELIAKIAMYVVMALSLVLIVGSALDVDPMAAGSMTGTVITWTIIVLGLSILGAVISEVIGVIKDTGNLVKSLIGLVAAVALIAGCWAMSDGTPLVIQGYEGSDNVAPWLNIADTGIFIFYIMGAVAVLSIIGSEIYQLFK